MLISYQGDNMITKENYHKTKRYVKALSKPQIKELCADMELNDLEAKLLISSYDGESVIKICMDNYICESAYTKYIKMVYSKVYNYFRYKNISF